MPTPLRVRCRQPTDEGRISNNSDFTHWMYHKEYKAILSHCMANFLISNPQVQDHTEKYIWQKGNFGLHATVPYHVTCLHVYAATPESGLIANSRVVMNKWQGNLRLRATFFKIAGEFWNTYYFHITFQTNIHTLHFKVVTSACEEHIYIYICMYLYIYIYIGW